MSVAQTHLTVGAWAEDLALHYLQQQGLKICMRNFRCRLGEIDLIMQEKQTLVFVEVKYRQKHRFGGALAAITPIKCKKMHQTASYYLQQRGLYDVVPCRFDAIVIEGSPSKASYQWIKNILS